MSDDCCTRTMRWLWVSVKNSSVYFHSSEKASYFHSVKYYGVFAKCMGGAMATQQKIIMGSRRKKNRAAQA